MRVSILTQPLGHNYGGLLQAYALQVSLKKMGCDVETLDRRVRTSWVGILRGYFRDWLRLALGRIETLPTERRQAFILQDLARFRERYINMSKPIFTEELLRQYYRESRFDVVLVGSDQVWRPRYSPSLCNYYLDFLCDVDAPVTRLSYAASFGVDEWEYTPEETRKCKALIEKFDAISVREASAVELCKEYLNVEVACMVDPTLLLDEDEYRELVADTDPIAIPGQIMVYFLDSSPEKDLVVDKFVQWSGLQPYRMMPQRKITEVKPCEIGLCQYPSVEQWLSGFRNAGFVVTDSFHGCVFSIIFNKPFVAVGNAERGLSRFQSLLGDFGLSKRLALSADDVRRELLITPVDWDAVNGVRKEKAESARRFLRVNILGDMS